MKAQKKKHSLSEIKALDALNAKFRSISRLGKQFGAKMANETSKCTNDSISILEALDKKLQKEQDEFDRLKSKIKSPLKFNPYSGELFFAYDDDGREVFFVRVTMINYNNAFVSAKSMEDAEKKMKTILECSTKNLDSEQKFEVF